MLATVALLAIVLLVARQWPGNLPASNDADTPRHEVAAATSDDESSLEGRIGVSAHFEPTELATSWMTRYRESEDHFAFAEEAAKAAVEGDVRAQYTLSQVLLECYVEVGLTVAMNQGNLAANIEARAAAFPGYQEHNRVQIRAKIRRCERFFDGSPLATLALPDEAQSHGYWFDKAVAAGDPLAVMDRALKAVAQVDESADAATKRALGAAVMDDVRVAVASGEPAALAKVGWMYTQTLASDRTFQGPAWLVAACQLGYDCSNANPEIGQGCAEAGTCSAALTLADIFQRDLGAQEYARIYAAGQDIAYKVTQGDWEGLQRYLQMSL